MADTKTFDTAKEFGSLATEAAAIAAIDKLSIGVNDQTAMRRFAGICYEYGKGSKGNSAPDCTPLLIKFNTKYRGDGTGRPEQKEGSSSFKTYASAFGGYAVLGHAKVWKPDDKQRVFDWCIDNLKLQYSKRGKFLRALVEELKDTPPTTETLIERQETAAGSAKLSARSATLLRACKSLFAIEATKTEPQKAGEFMEEIKNNEALRTAYVRAVNALSEFDRLAQAGGTEAGNLWADLEAAA